MISFDSVLLYLRDAIAVVGVAIITFGCVRGARQCAHYLRHGRPSLNAVRLGLGDTIILGLEFMVGADIVGSVVEPDYYSIGLLGLLVLIRTILSYFLTHELQAISSAHKEQK